MSNVKEVRFVTVSRPSRTEPGTQRVQMFYSPTKEEPSRLVDIGVIVRDRGIQKYRASFIDGTGLVPLENFFATRSQAGHGIARAFEGARQKALETAMLATEPAPTPHNDNAGPEDATHDRVDDGSPAASTQHSTSSNDATSTETAPPPSGEPEVSTFKSKAEAIAALGISKSALRKRIQRGTLVIAG